MPLDSDPNKVYRKKYFMDADKVVFSPEPPSETPTPDLAKVIDAAAVHFSEKPIRLNFGLSAAQLGEANVEADAIVVEPIREGDSISHIRIVCPCGRHTEVAVEYREEENHPSDA